MTSPLPPRLRDTRTLADRVRQDRINLRQLGVGFLGGRYPPARPLGATALYGDVEADDGGDEEATAWEYNDRHVVVVAATAHVATLSHEPLDESLQVYWHPRGLTYAPLRWPSEQFTVEGSRVTIPDTTGLIEANDAFSFQYEYLVGDGGEVLVQELFVDSLSSAAVAGPTLDDGGTYRIEVIGTFTVHNDPVVYGSSVPLIYPSGTPTWAESDVEWGYGSSTTSGSYPRLSTASPLQYRHGSGSWITWAATTTTPDGTRTYERTITGQGLALSFRFFDSAYGDNAGKIRVQVYQE